MIRALKKSFQEIEKNVMSKKSELQIFLYQLNMSACVPSHIFTADKLMEINYGNCYFSGNDVHL
jgi:hypothetical protein